MILKTFYTWKISFIGLVCSECTARRITLNHTIKRPIPVLGLGGLGLKSRCRSSSSSVTGIQWPVYTPNKIVLMGSGFESRTPCSASKEFALKNRVLENYIWSLAKNITDCETKNLRKGRCSLTLLSCTLSDLASANFFCSTCEPCTKYFSCTVTWSNPIKSDVVQLIENLWPRVRISSGT